jgi:hypothetical protein
MSYFKEGDKITISGLKLGKSGSVKGKLYFKNDDRISDATLEIKEVRNEDIQPEPIAFFAPVISREDFEKMYPDIDGE